MQSLALRFRLIVFTEDKQVEAKEFYTHKEAADWIGISYRALWSKRKSGEIAFLQFGRSIKYHKPDLEDFVKRSRVEAVAIPAKRAAVAV